jgi:hypothetical protein
MHAVFSTPSLATLLSGHDAGAPRRRGRPSASDADRAKQLEAARLRLLMGWPPARIASLYRISTATVHRWVRSALESPEGSDLRAFRD